MFLYELDFVLIFNIVLMSNSVEANGQNPLRNLTLRFCIIFTIIYSPSETLVVLFDRHVTNARYLANH